MKQQVLVFDGDTMIHVAWLYGSTHDCHNGLCLAQAQYTHPSLSMQEVHNDIFQLEIVLDVIDVNV